jgi:prevent-host-death family protein
METAAVSELKSSLSEYLSKVKVGEEILITERGKPVAKIIPLERGAKQLSAHLDHLSRAGLVNMGTGKLPKEFWKMDRPKDKRGKILKALLHEREEGR